MYHPPIYFQMLHPFIYFLLTPDTIDFKPSGGISQIDVAPPPFSFVANNQLEENVIPGPVETEGPPDLAQHPVASFSPPFCTASGAIQVSRRRVCVFGSVTLLLICLLPLEMYARWRGGCHLGPCIIHRFLLDVPFVRIT